MNYLHIKFDLSDAVAIITLSRPEVLNSFNRAMAMEMQDALDLCANDGKIRAVYVTGAGRAFCAGQDLAEATAENAPPIAQIVREHYNPIIKKIRTLEKPVVCGVNGVAAGAGANIALACDIVVASENASFIQSFSNIGLIPDSGGTFFLPRLVGLQRATAMMFLADKVAADKAQQIGMVYKVFSDDILQQEALAIATKLSEMPTKGLGLTKRALNQSLFNTLEDQLDIEEKLQSQAASTRDNKEGINAFLEKRKPVFKGE